MERQQEQADVACGYCQQIPHMINLAWDREELELAEVLTNVLHQHRWKKHRSGRRLRVVGTKSPVRGAKAALDRDVEVDPARVSLSTPPQSLGKTDMPAG
ncbi:hypothetical protein ACIGW3_31900 [Streptomyces sp. NPDC053499]|uniref:hypothetical protein n=1 Tax=Streptomyces sp. NPDC053499 TaxID=3365707 RepID=UPI0037D59E7F